MLNNATNFFKTLIPATLEMLSYRSVINSLSAENNYLLRNVSEPMILYLNSKLKKGLRGQKIKKYFYLLQNFKITLREKASGFHNTREKKERAPSQVIHLKMKNVYPLSL